MSAPAGGTIPWQAGPSYEVAFTTRGGGVSDAPFDSLNLSWRTGDDPGRVIENRRRLCAQVGSDPGFATLLRQQHGTRVVAATPTGIADAEAEHEPADGLWSDRPGLAMVVLTADCLPLAIARAGGDRPALTVLHAGWRGLLGGIVGNGARAISGGRLVGAVGPGIGPCCYEVGEEVAAPFRARFGAGVVRGGRLDLWAAAEQALREAGCVEVERVDLCTACHPELFFSHRRDGEKTGRQGVIARVA